MKRFERCWQFILFFILINPLICVSQLQKGDMFLGANLNFGYAKNQWYWNDQLTQESKGTSFRLGLDYSVMCSNRFDLTINVGYTTTKNTYYPNTPGSLNDATIKFFPEIPVGLGTRYLFPISSKLYVSIDFFGNYLYTKILSQNNGGSSGTNFLKHDDTYHKLNFDLGPGLTYIFTKRWSARMHLGVFYYSYNINNSVTSNGFDHTEKVIYEDFSILANGVVPSFAFYFQLNNRKNKTISNE